MNVGFTAVVEPAEARAYAGSFTAPRSALSLERPLAILHGEGEQLVSLDYLRQLTIPTLWRGAVQLIPGAGHAPHQETPAEFTALLTQFTAGLE